DRGSLSLNIGEREENQHAEDIKKRNCAHHIESVKGQTLWSLDWFGLSRTQIHCILAGNSVTTTATCVWRPQSRHRFRKIAWRSPVVLCFRSCGPSSTAPRHSGSEPGQEPPLPPRPAPESPKPGLDF